MEDVEVWNKLSQQLLLFLPGAGLALAPRLRISGVLISKIPSTLESAQHRVTVVCPGRLSGALF